jgi:hypothetical protein
LADQNDALKQIAAALAAVGASVGGRAIANASGNPLQQAVPPQLNALLDSAVNRQKYQDPLFQATTQGVYSMLPTFAKQGTSLGASVPTTTTPTAQSGGNGPGLGTAAGIGGAAALAGLLGNAPSGGAFDLGKIINGLKKVLGIGGEMNHGTIDNAGWLPSYDPFSGGMGMNDPSNQVGMPNDPSGGTGIGPGMQSYYNSQGSQGGARQGDTGNWWDE